MAASAYWLGLFFYYCCPWPPGSPWAMARALGNRPGRPVAPEGPHRAAAPAARRVQPGREPGRLASWRAVGRAARSAGVAAAKTEGQMAAAHLIHAARSPR